MSEVLNHNLSYRPLLGGIGIRSAVLQEPGTLGCIATSDGTDSWLISCCHVLWDITGVDRVADGDWVEQPFGVPVATVDATRRNPALDCAAALIAREILVSKGILGLPSPRPPIAPVEGMRVLKSGAATGVTEGIITGIMRGIIEIAGPAPGYEISGQGDSGSVWIEADSGALVGLHFQLSPVGRAGAYSMRDVLDALNLRLFA